MVHLITTPRIQAALEAVAASQRAQLELPSTPTLHAPITHEQLLRLARHLQSDTTFQARSPTVLSELLRGTTVYVAPPPKKPEPSPEYLATKARLLAAQEEAAYRRLLYPSATLSSAPSQQELLHIYDDHAVTGSEAPIFTEDPLTPSLVLNIFLSVLITGFSVYWALTKFSTPHFLAAGFASWTGLQRTDGHAGGQGASESVRVLLALFAALAVAVAESFLYAAYLGKVERARIKERKMKERKVVVGEVEADQNEVDVDVGQRREEIWGRGANGGVRRRVREKWEREGKDKEKENGIS